MEENARMNIPEGWEEYLAEKYTSDAKIVELQAPYSTARFSEAQHQTQQSILLY